MSFDLIVACVLLRVWIRVPTFVTRTNIAEAHQSINCRVLLHRRKPWFEHVKLLFSHLNFQNSSVGQSKLSFAFFLRFFIRITNVVGTLLKKQRLFVGFCLLVLKSYRLVSFILFGLYFADQGNWILLSNEKVLLVFGGTYYFLTCCSFSRSVDSRWWFFGGTLF